MGRIVVSYWTYWKRHYAESLTPSAIVYLSCSGIYEYHVVQKVVKWYISWSLLSLSIDTMRLPRLRSASPLFHLFLPFASSVESSSISRFCLHDEDRHQV